MGGRGSGRSSGSGRSTGKCNEYHSIDLAWLKRKGGLRPGYTGNVQWSRCGQPTGNIDYRVEQSGLLLSYRTRSHGGEWRNVSEHVSFSQTKTEFNGQRRWFLCPGCGRRCRILYGGSYFRCRRCHQLKYESQYEQSFGRAASMSHKLREKLGYSGTLVEPFPPKPIGMHWKTYWQAEERDAELQQRWELGLIGWMNRLK